ncbi:hypothetical protein B0H14DRAFT_3514461 [Mycena olivaceomarginata]|nr:hypothetical protein B0H14DRAFT_3514461 [Mycena olivaceomarginata]
MAEAVNLPAQPVSSNPHFVVKDTEWIMWSGTCSSKASRRLDAAAAKAEKKKGAIPFVKLNPVQAITLGSKQLQVPQPGYQTVELVHLREAELFDEDHHATDQARRAVVAGSAPKGPLKDDWKHDVAYVQRTVELLMPPPIAIRDDGGAARAQGDAEGAGEGAEGTQVTHSFDETLPIAKDLKRE